MAISAENALKCLTTARQKGGLAHAYLICGAPGSGKNELTKKLAMLILQIEKDPLDSHPDFYCIQPTSKSRRILIDQMRILEQFIQKRPSIGTAKVAIIQEADRLAPNAANAFLKTLEEPPSNTYLFLLTNQPDSLLPTIISRCIQVPLHLQKKRETHPHEHTVMDLFDRCLQSSLSQIARAFQFCRGFQSLLTQYKEQNEILEKFEADKEHYKKTTDGKWLQDREEYLKALAESNTLRMRRSLIASIERLLAEALRNSYLVSSHISSPSPRRPTYNLPPKTLIRQLECLGRLQQILDRGVNESLALETCFLEIFAL